MHTRASTCNEQNKSANNKVMQAMIAVMAVSNSANGGTLHAGAGFGLQDLAHGDLSSDGSTR
jgi:hypothetical protein